MGLLDALGLGGVFGSCPPEYPSLAYNQWQQYIQAQQYIPTYHCRHGADCPMCLEIAKKQGEEIKKREEIKTQKKLDYENRCKIYMDKFKSRRS